MKDFATGLAALAAGALAMYYFDPQSGAQRRAALADLVEGGLGTTRRPARRAMRRRTFHRIARADPQSDARLRDDIRARLGRLVSHPRAIDVQVEDGVVRLSGDVLSAEREGLLEQVIAMPGVQMRLVDDVQALWRERASELLSNGICHAHGIRIAA